MDEIRKTLERVIYTLNRIDVRGQDNLNALLGCIQAVEKVTAVLAEAQKQAAEGAASEKA